VGQREWAGLDPRGDFKWNMIFEFQMNLDFGKTLRISIRRFRRNLDMRIFPKFFYASQGLLENKIFHATNATLGQLNWGILLFRLKSQKCNIMHFYLDRILLFKKWVLQTCPP
jgi:hypothetical protein